MSYPYELCNNVNVLYVVGFLFFLKPANYLLLLFSCTSFTELTNNQMLDSCQSKLIKYRLWDKLEIKGSSNDSNIWRHFLIMNAERNVTTLPVLPYSLSNLFIPASEDKKINKNQN